VAAAAAVAAATTPSLGQRRLLLHPAAYFSLSRSMRCATDESFSNLGGLEPKV
jgi:hypothetical protein